MSRYVPAFLKEQHQANNSPTDNSGWNTVESRHKGSSNGFPMNRRDRPDDTPRKQVIPATLASLTAAGGGGGSVNSGGNMSFASKFTERVKVAQDPNYVPPPKPLNMNSQDDFPTLGLKSSKPSMANSMTNKVTPEPTIRQNVMTTQTVMAQKPAGKWASMAKAWAQQDEDEREAEHAREVEEERKRREMELLRSMPFPTFGHKRYNEYSGEYDDEEDEYNQDDKDSFVYESSDTEDEPSEHGEGEGEDGEFNSNTVWDGRRKDDLY
jgi:hypothetical protein